MTREKTYVVDLKTYSNSYVTFDDVANGRIKGICKMVSPILPCLNDVLMVEGLTTKLICIRQLYDQGLNVNFSKFECVIPNKDQEILTKRL